MVKIEGASINVNKAMTLAFYLAVRRRFQFVTPELLTLALTRQPQFRSLGECRVLKELLLPYIAKSLETVPEEVEFRGPEPSQQLLEVLTNAKMAQVMSGSDVMTVPHLINSILRLGDKSMAAQAMLLMSHGERGDLMAHVVESYNNEVRDTQKVPVNDDGEIDTKANEPSEQEYESIWDPEFAGDDEMPFSDSILPETDDSAQWRKYVTDLAEVAEKANPLIGREHELERTIQVLCRRDKNNPLHVGEAGVGKTAIAIGLMHRILEGRVPKVLSQARIYQLDLTSLLAGTQFRGQFEERLKGVLNGVQKQGGAILYIDEIHMLIGAGATQGDSMDASNILKPYLESGDIRFMGATTFDEYDKHFSHKRAFGRRFQKIDIAEPTVAECRLILQGVADGYAKYHNVRYTPEAIDFAAEGAAKYITDRFLPDKAIDLLDEAGARARAGAKTNRRITIDKKAISETLARICRVDTLSESVVQSEAQRLQALEQALRSRVFGQDKAISQVAMAVQLGAAGLIDDNKPMASLLFVGPTGVGKTEVARVLAKQLGMPLLRFDMSEYAEKHAVAKLIGAPAGYVGYDDGGQLTDAVRRQPHSIVLFDEIEKAHADIYNILLQVMDEASLTDNRGQKADFRHTIIILTTNAGAQDASQAAVGFASTRTAGQAMMKRVRQTFKPEFLNRLSDITIFNDMDRDMARGILNKKLDELRTHLTPKRITLTLTPEAMDYLLEQGYSAEYGGRQIERAIGRLIKPDLMRAMLYGDLAQGGKAQFKLDANGALVLHAKPLPAKRNIKKT